MTFSRITNFLLSVFFVGAFFLLTVKINAQMIGHRRCRSKPKPSVAAQISPDGKRIVYTVSEAVITADKSEFVTQIGLANTDGTNDFQITFGDKSSTNPKWSPDGNWLAFTSNRKDNKNNLYIFCVTGGEAEHVDRSERQHFQFRMVARRKMDRLCDERFKTEDEEKNDKGRNDFRWVDENHKNGAAVCHARDEGRERKTRARKN